MRSGALRLGRREFGAHEPVIMAIVNRTPDSFYDQGATFRDEPALARVEQAIADGAAIVDIGGVKAGPGEEVTAEEEARRTVGFVAEVRRRHPDVVISVDTWRHDVGEAVCEAGADVLNDAWGGVDPKLAEVAARYGAGLVCTHAGGAEPRTRPHRIAYEDVMADILRVTAGLAERAVELGVRPDGIMIDPGHDFGKNTRHSLEATHAARRDDGDRLAGARLAVQQGLRRRDARPAGEGAGDRDAGDHRRLGVAGGAGVPGARGGGDPAGAGHGGVHRGAPGSRPWHGADWPDPGAARRAAPRTEPTPRTRPRPSAPPRPRSSNGSYRPTSFVTRSTASSTSSVTWNSSRSCSDALPCATTVFRSQSTRPLQ